MNYFLYSRKSCITYYREMTSKDEYETQEITRL